MLRLWLALRDTSAERLAEVERSARDYLGEEVEGIDREELLEAPAAPRRRRSSTSAPPTSSRPVTSRVPSRSRSTSSSSTSTSSPAIARSIAYCRGPFCVMAHEAVHRLRAAGRPARRLEEGWPEWRLAELEEAGVE